MCIHLSRLKNGDLLVAEETEVDHTVTGFKLQYPMKTSQVNTQEHTFSLWKMPGPPPIPCQVNRSIPPTLFHSKTNLYAPVAYTYRDLLAYSSSVISQVNVHGIVVIVLQWIDLIVTAQKLEVQSILKKGNVNKVRYATVSQ